MAKQNSSKIFISTKSEHFVTSNHGASSPIPLLEVEKVGVERVEVKSIAFERMNDDMVGVERVEVERMAVERVEVERVEVQSGRGEGGSWELGCWVISIMSLLTTASQKDHGQNFLLSLSKQQHPVYHRWVFHEGLKLGNSSTSTTCSLSPCVLLLPKGYAHQSILSSEKSAM